LFFRTDKAVGPVSWGSYKTSPFGKLVNCKKNMIKKTKRSIQWVQKTKTQKYAGIHLIVEFWQGKKITSSKKIEQLLLTAVKRAKSTPLETITHEFEPQGITGVVLLAESHLALHTWPEIGYIALDIFTCGDKAKPYKALDYLKKELKPKKVEITEVKRGRMKI
jgi:S-adenosylmethionine decarboxylase